METELQHRLRLNPCWPDEDTAENRLKKTLFIVEATSYEQHTLWRDHAKESRWSQYGPEHRQDWQQLNGWLITVGSMGTAKGKGKYRKRPCCISATWYRIDGHLVMFYEQCSQVTDSVQTDKWLDKHFAGTYDGGHRRARTEATNFGHCLSAIREANTKIKVDI